MVYFGKLTRFQFTFFFTDAIPTSLLPKAPAVNVCMGSITKPVTIGNPKSLKTLTWLG
jgi:hypothetical protein